tara:strand:+ start:678 stop:1547 length:870 start_codon:yes stop_codon:yes gene_type:complete
MIISTQEIIMSTIAGMKANRVNLNGPATHPKVWHLPEWKSASHPQRMAFMRKIALQAGHDPRLATLAVSIFKKHGIRPRNYKAQAAALLNWVQTKIYYINEPSERLQDPLTTLKVGYGDCDDMVMLLCALFESVRLEWRFVLAGKSAQGMVRWIEGTPLPSYPVQFNHIYCMVGYPPFKPQKWFFAEPTVGKKLGWDVIAANRKGESFLPELAGIEQPAPVEEKRGQVLDLSPPDKGMKKKAVDIWIDIKKGLDPVNMIPILIVGAISTVLAQEIVRPYVRKLYKNLTK